MKVLDYTHEIDEEKLMEAWASRSSPASPEAMRNAQELIRAFAKNFADCLNDHAMAHGFWKPDASDGPIIVYVGRPQA